MSYLVLARKYRPRNFAELVGQEHVAAALRNAIETDRVAHAFLFTGIRGVGKTTAARALAKGLNCEQGPTADPCDECGNCKEIAASNSVDVAEIDGASNRGIDAIRELNDTVRYMPAKSRFRIFIIDEAHMVTREGFNALLKTLEEPPAHVKFIFATTAYSKFPDTIVSRCQRYDFKRIPTKRICEHLGMIAGKEDVSITESALYSVAREGDGSMRDAESILDRVIAFAGGGEIDEAKVAEIVGVADRGAVHRATDAVLAADPGAALAVVDALHDAGKDLERFSRDLVEHWRDLVIQRVAPDSPALAELPGSEREVLAQQASTWAATDLQRGFRVVHAGDMETKGAPYPRFVVEMTLVRLATFEPATPVDEVLARLEALESGAPIPPRRPPAAPAPERRPSAAPQASSPEPSAPPARPSSAPRAARPAVAATAAPAPIAPSAAVRAAAEPAAPTAVAGDGTRWDEFLRFVQGKKITLAMTLQNCTVVDFRPGAMVIGAVRDTYRREIERREVQVVIEEFASEFYGTPTVVSLGTVDERPPEPPVPGAPVEKKSPALIASEHVLVRRALDQIPGSELKEALPRRDRDRRS